MRRVFAIALTFALLAPTLASAQEHHRPEVRPGVRPFMPPRGGPAQFSYRGRMINRVQVAPFVYPRGWAYRRWGIGVALPAIFLTSAYFYANWAALGLAAPEPGFQWVRYGPDLLLVNTSTGQIADAVYGAFY